MSLIKKIKQFINGSWQEFSLSSGTLDNVVTLDGNEEIITGSKVFSRGSFNSAPKAGTNIAGSEIYVCQKDLEEGNSEWALITPNAFTLTYSSGMPVTYGKEGITWGAKLFNFPIDTPTGNETFATQEWVEGVIAGKVDYLGTAANVSELATLVNKAVSVTPGDYCRASADFTLLGQPGEQVHVGDILIYKVNKADGGATNVPSDANWDIIHTEDPGNYASLEGNNILNGYNTFEGGVEFNCDYSHLENGKRNGFNINVDYSGEIMQLQVNPGGLFFGGDTTNQKGVLNIDPRMSSDQITYTPNSSNLGYNYTLPTKTGTFALLSDIPDLSNYATLTGENEFTGANSFTGPLQAVGNSYITQYRTDSIFASQFGEEGTTRSYLKYPMGSGMLGVEQKIQQGVEGYIATREWAINKLANQMSWSQDLIDSCIDLGGWTIKFNTNTNYETDSSKWPVTAWLISSGGYALGVGGPPRVQLKGIDGKQFDTITIAEYIGVTQWQLNKLTLPDDFGCITKAVVVSGEPSAEYDASPIYWDQWEHIMPGGFTKETVFDELKLIPALENTQNNRSAKLIIGGGKAPGGMPDSSVEISYNGIYFKEGISSGSDWEISKSGTTFDQLMVSGTVAAGCLYLAGPSTFGSFENLGGYIYSTSYESIYALPIFNDSQKSNICDWFAVSQSNFNTIATQEWVQAQGYDAAPTIYTPDSALSTDNRVGFNLTDHPLKEGHLYKIIVDYAMWDFNIGNRIEFHTSYDFIYNGIYMSTYPQNFSIVMGDIMSEYTIFPNATMNVGAGINPDTQIRELAVYFYSGDSSIPSFNKDSLVSNVKIVEVR